MPKEISTKRESIRELILSILQCEDVKDIRKLFANKCPFFLPMLRSTFPKITYAEETLCIFIILGLDNEEIAARQGINKDSVNA